MKDKGMIKLVFIILSLLLMPIILKNLFTTFMLPSQNRMEPDFKVIEEKLDVKIIKKIGQMDSEYITGDGTKKYGMIIEEDNKNYLLITDVYFGKNKGDNYSNLYIKVFPGERIDETDKDTIQAIKDRFQSDDIVVSKHKVQLITIGSNEVIKSLMLYKMILKSIDDYHTLSFYYDEMNYINTYYKGYDALRDF